MLSGQGVHGLCCQILFSRFQRSQDNFKCPCAFISSHLVARNIDFLAHFGSILSLLGALTSQPSHPDTSCMTKSELQKVLQRFQTFLEPQVSLINTHFLIKKSNIFAHFDSLLHVLSTLISQPSHPETCYMSSSELQEVPKRFQTLLESSVDIWK